MILFRVNLSRQIVLILLLTWEQRMKATISKLLRISEMISLGKFSRVNKNEFLLFSIVFFRFQCYDKSLCFSIKSQNLISLYLETLPCFHVIKWDYLYKFRGRHVIKPIDWKKNNQLIFLLNLAKFKYFNSKMGETKKHFSNLIFFLSQQKEVRLFFSISWLKMQ